MPNLMQILSIFLKLQAVKQSGPTLFAYPVHSCEVMLPYQLLYVGEMLSGRLIVHLCVCVRVCAAR